MQRLRSRFDELLREWGEARSRYPWLSAAVVAVAAFVAVAPIVFGAWFLVSLFSGLPDVGAIQRIGEMDQATAVYDDDDKLAFTIYKEQRIEVPLTQVSPHVVHALTAIEDQRFYDHRGIDLVRIASAALANLRHRRAVQGASTLTQQLARQSFLTPDKTLRRKLQEVVLASRIEQMYSKPKILELYLNKVYFGDGLYGIEAAARGYLDKHAADLNITEAALLAGLVQSPSSYAPTVSMTRAIARRNRVLRAMFEVGAIDRPTLKNALAAKITLHDGLHADEPHGQYFKEQVRLELVQRFGWQRVYQGGLRVFSTINMPLEIAAESAVAESLKAVEQRRASIVRRANARSASTRPPADDAVLQAALLSMDPHTGHVRAMVGGRNFDESHFNRAVQARRQPGSAFKPFVYAAAIEQGYSPATVIDHLDDPIATPKGGWMPEDEHSDASSMTLRTALRTSSNRAAVQLLQQVGLKKTVDYVRQLGIGDVPAVPSLALGAGEVTVQSMTAAYAAFANGGLVPKPILIRRVEDREGRVLYRAQDSSTRAIKETTAFLMSTMMADVINAGTGWRARQVGFMLPAAGKTGTTNDFHDAWFVGFTPSIVTGVWVGFDQPRTILPNGFAADIAVPLWANFMKTATHGDKPEWLTPPSGLTTATVCRISGKLATDACRDVPTLTSNGSIERRSMVYTEYFVRDTEPTTYCDVHTSTGLLTRVAGVVSGEDRPAARIESVGTPSSVPVAAASGAPPPTDDGAAQTAPPKKRGFWSRVFGIGRERESKSLDVAPKKKPGGE